MDNGVRQVLMGELGLTREIIREEMYSIIREEVQRELQKPEFVHLLRNAILHPKYGVRSEIVDRSSQRIVGIILRKFGVFLKDNPNFLLEE